ncbi:aldo/keto reductase [Aeromicrobium halocynthiae]|uniref:Aldo/keto reductase n=1 Tax=Aeromicrobium halocynthiae TaxID=560557 RepID=A0ABN2VXI3_9ACTN
MQQRSIGDVRVGAVGLGAMPMSVGGRPDRDRSIATIHAALDAGVTLVDTADAYHLDASDPGHNEELVAEALASHPAGADVLVATKGGHTRPADGSWALDGSPEHLAAAARESARRLGVEAIGLYQLHRPDPDVPFAESVGALADLLDAGVIAMAGVSNVSIAQIEEADEILDGRLASVQNEFSPAFLSSRGELEHCAARGIAFLPWSPFGGIGRAGDLGTEHSVFQHVADAHGASAHRVALAWHLQIAPVVVPIPGASRPESVTDSAAAADLVLTDDEVRSIDASLG